MTITDEQIDAKYESGKYRLLQEIDRIKLPELVNTIESKPDYMVIEPGWISSWDKVIRSRLIESFLINIPVHPLVVYETTYGSYQVIDGQERLKTIVDFYSERLTLTGLEVETYLEGRTYSTLPSNVKRQLDRKSLTSINCILDSALTELEREQLIGIIKKRYATNLL